MATLAHLPGIWNVRYHDAPGKQVGKHGYTGKRETERLTFSNGPMIQMDSALEGCGG